MRHPKIYKLDIAYTNFIIGFKNADPVSSYFSNLTHAVNALKAALTLNDWSDEGINYTAIYRSLREKRIYNKAIKLNGLKYITIKLSTITLNPTIETIGIDKKPKID